ncbi:MAG: potassium channel protein [Bacteroidales bacterium]|nr:potassium channel protein [Bacteroidales bacterium]
MKRQSFKPVYLSVIFLILAILIGITGYMVIEGFNFTDAFFMTIITMATVGFREVHPLSPVGMWFTAFLIIFSFGIFAYAVTTLTRYVIDGIFRNYYKDNKVKSKIKKLSGHVILCGFGRNGRQAVTELLEHDVDIVIVDRNEEVMEELRLDKRLLYINGDATQDEILHAAQIETAKSIITTLPDDAENLFIVLSARQINPKIKIISRASGENADIKLKRAGANNVIMPDRIGGQRMAKLVTQPDVVEFIEFLMLQRSFNVSIAEISCKNINREFSDKSIGELDIRNISGANIIGLKTAEKNYILNPSSDIKLSPDDQIFVLGTPEQIEKLKNVMSGAEKKNLE